MLIVELWTVALCYWLLQRCQADAYCRVTLWIVAFVLFIIAEVSNWWWLWSYIEDCCFVLLMAAEVSSWWWLWSYIEDCCFVLLIAAEVSGWCQMVIVELHWSLFLCTDNCCRSVKLMLLGMLVIIVFALCWLPFVNNLDSVRSVLIRLFPFGRGLYEVGLPLGSTNLVGTC